MHLISVKNVSKLIGFVTPNKCLNEKRAQADPSYSEYTRNELTLRVTRAHYTSFFNRIVSNIGFLAKALRR